MNSPLTLKAIQARIRSFASPAGAKAAARFHKTGPGEYADGQIFLGLDAAALKSLAREYRELPIGVIGQLLRSPTHDERGVALLVMVLQMAKGDGDARRAIYDLYLANTRFINSWSLVDCSAPGVVGAYLLDRRRTVLDKLAKSKSLWERRISIVATQTLIRRGEFDDTFRISEKLLDDREDLIHKATGWMLREVGKRDQPALERFLRRHYDRLPRTTLRYAIERFSEPLRQSFLRGNLR